eukprot:1561324-Amphidinium_carterae.1
MVEEQARTVDLCWVDTNKGDELRPNVRSRFCAREIKKAMPSHTRLDSAELFSGMPPLEAL